MSDQKPNTNPFDPASLRVEVDYATETPVKRLLTNIPIDKPRREVFVRVHPGADHQQTVLILDYERDKYLVQPQPILQQALQGEVRTAQLFTGVTRQGDVFLWPVTLPGLDGRHNPWHASALAAAKKAQSHWVRLTPNSTAGFYDIHYAMGDLGEPQWPEESLGDLLVIAHRSGRVIDSLDHPVLKKLRGEM